MTDPSDDPDSVANTADLRAFASRLGPLLACLRGRVLTADERASLQTIAAQLAELRTIIAFDLEDDDGAALRRVLGEHREGRA